MLIIRSSQREKLDAYSLTQYMAALCRHLVQFDPVLCGAAGLGAVEKAVDIGLRQAHQCGFALDGPIRTFLEIMLVLGSEFDRDPQYSWLVPWLQPVEHYQEMERAQYLHFHVVRYLDYIEGRDGSHGVAALKKAQQVTRNQLKEIGEGYPEKAIRLLESINPLKCRFIGRREIQSLIQLAVKEADQAKLKSLEGATLILVLMFSFGSGILRDPMYPWVTRSLDIQDEKNEELTEDNRLGRLLEQFQTYKT